MHGGLSLRPGLVLRIGTAMGRTDEEEMPVFVGVVFAVAVGWWLLFRSAMRRRKAK